MRRPSVVLRTLASSVVLALSACGGGGGGGGGGGTTVLLEANLAGSSETTVVDATARALAFVKVSDNGSLEFATTGEAWAASVTALDVRFGGAGVDGPSVVNLLGAAAFDVPTRTASGSLLISPALASAILAAPGGYYVDVRTSAAAAGLARGQLATATSLESHAVLLGSQETTVVDSGARGGAALRVGPDGVLTWIAAMTSPSVASITQAHIHAGAAGVAGPVLVDLNAPGASVNAAAGTMTGTATAPLSSLSRVAFDPAGFYVNVHTAAAPNGVARGPVAVGTADCWAVLRGDLETAVVDAAARGAVGLELQSFSTGRAYLAVPAAQGISSVTGARVHVGAAGVVGAPLIDLMAGGDFATSTGANSAEGTIALDMTTYARLLGNPGSLYANFTTSGAPGGLVRGQVTQTPQTVATIMSGTQQVPPADPAALGTISIVFTGVHACSFQMDLTSPAPGAITGLHIHDGVAGVNGPILIALDGGTLSIAGSSMVGATTFTGTTFPRVLSNPAAFYANAHTLAFPNGIERGQLSLLSADTAPAGLSYSTPVSYVTAAAIVPNLPHSTGGAVASYSVAPPLPTGLTLNPTTGVITGTPSVTAAGADYVVTATNATGSTQATVHITVTVSAPLTLSYTTPVTYVVGTAISPNNPVSTGGAIASYSVLPALPAGLGVNPTTGVISGTPTAAATGADYVVTGTNSAGFVTATVHVQVDSNLTAPSGLSYSTQTYSTGYAITPNTPTIGGGPADTWSVSPALPAGLALSATTGVITGTPTTITSQGTYTVTASNGAGSTQGSVTITVVLGAPTGLSYSNNPNIAYLSYGLFASMTPTISGGGGLTYTVSPALPAGINIDANTGVIGGTPAASNAQTTYTVTATNAAGFTTASPAVVITIYP